MQHGIVKIKLGDKDRVLKFNQYCLINIAQVLKCDPLQIGIALNTLVQKNMVRAMVILTWGAIMGYNEEIADYENDIVLADVAKWVQEANFDDLAPMWEAFKLSLGISDTLAKQGQKKKTVAKHKKSVTGK